jgi:4-diphosphocytidyl-2-C-methyl-D-erythritol kinase
MPILTIEAPAKVNLHLRVKDRRPDGFHNLESIFAALAFGDTLRFELLDEDKTLEIHMKFQREPAPMEPVPPEKNIIFKAVSLFRSRTGYTRGLRIWVNKRIPLGGGLGGGSSDAASTLLALNSLYTTSGLGADSLAEMAASLGSDVPFFLTETSAAWVSGCGERITSLEAPKNLFFVLVNPGFPSVTAEAFRLLDEFRERQGENNARRDAEARGSTGKVPGLELGKRLSPSPRDWSFENDFLPVLGATAEGEKGAAYREILGRLRDLGADFAGLSGAGSTCFGVFTDREKAEKAEKNLLKTWNFVKISFLLARKALSVLK